MNLIKKAISLTLIKGFDKIKYKITKKNKETGSSTNNKLLRAEYKEIWNKVSENIDSAKVSIAGITDDDEFFRTAKFTVQILKDRVGINKDDVILEIGAGIGRVAQVIAPLCKKWIGTDVSENMLKHAKKRLSNFKNIELTNTNGWDLKQIPSESVDMVYSTVVFMHLDEWERYNYICEGMRILKPGGRIYVDNFNLLSKMGWELFIKAMKDHHPLDRPSNISKSSTPQELQTYLERAGFIKINILESDDMWTSAFGIKPKQHLVPPNSCK